jgi:uncharacterized protein (TIGR03435 family)
MATSRVVWAIGIISVVGGVGAVLPAQTPASHDFEVASVKPNTSRDGERTFDLRPGGGFTATYATVRDLVQFAYQLPDGHLRHDSQIAGGPSWINSDRFDVVAKAEGMPAGLDADRAAGAARRLDIDAIEQVRLMVRRLLADRFKLTTHTESRALPVYALVTARRDGKLGPQLRKTDTDCVALSDAGRRPPQPTSGGVPCGGFTRSGPGRMTGHAVTMSTLATSFPESIGRVVLDRSGLTGVFDLDLEWTPDQPSRPGEASAGRSSAADGPSIFTAVQEQLGLKLRSERDPVNVLVIDRADHPTED